MALTRRAFSIGAVSLAGASLSRDARAEDEPSPGPKVLLAGDSMIAGGLGMFLERSLRKTHGHDV
ncbi:MAG: hypothetical protein KUG77_21970, partial [Nannocystaceae bacterium]|nr:hypothetical protein [Nannocystaceae bacterium]